MNHEPWPLEAIAGLAGICIVGAIAIGLKIVDLYQWHANRKALSPVSVATIKVVR